jgi:plasmid stabilization system protein ParE
MLPFILDEKAAQEIEDGISYFDTNTPGRGDEFRDAVDSEIYLIRTHPKIGAVYRNQYRKRVVPKFGHSVFYIHYPDHIWIVSVYPAKREPDTWMTRQHPSDFN